ncbi:MAG: hypothetical protein U0527_04970 [Candidatus Eisenbacteria bacterium]
MSRGAETSTGATDRPGLRLGIDATPLASLPKGGIGFHHVEYLVRALAQTGSLSEILLFSNRAALRRGTPPGPAGSTDTTFRSVRSGCKPSCRA